MTVSSLWQRHYSTHARQRFLSDRSLSWGSSSSSRQSRSSPRPLTGRPTATRKPGRRVSIDAQIGQITGRPWVPWPVPGSLGPTDSWWAPIPAPQTPLCSSEAAHPLPCHVHKHWLQLQLQFRQMPNPLERHSHNAHQADICTDSPSQHSLPHCKAFKNNMASVENTKSFYTPSMRCLSCNVEKGVMLAACPTKR